MSRLRSAWLFLAVILVIGLLFCWSQCRASDVPCAHEPAYQGVNACNAPGPCELRAGQILYWSHGLGGGLELFRVCDEYDTCFDFPSLKIDGPDCYRTIWPGVSAPIPPHRYWDRGGPVTLSVVACNAVACSDPIAAFVLLDPWYVPLQVIE